MDKILLNRMAFYGYHGVFTEETKLGQRFYVDIILELDLKKAGELDDLVETVNYAEVYRLCLEIVEGKAYKLIEAVAEKIAETIFVRFEKVQACTIKVIKPDPPIPGHYESVAVEITRRRP
ncbi:dihydroneopterin aldolase [Bacillus oleivorans]|uniref:7,8-dihydroneopterin aldolase n=1 Tax=Bacillus oleivorans TaxID=1448271 RepID=A0A285D778_9BACI|nr:dihydroneopterin aldolase [Bacillus oleivorans]SNX75681.1 dihydroneopterin aldolase [Bacillus oleivorans]